MANTTSGTTTFDKNLFIDDIIEEAYERCGLRGVAGYQLKTARRSLNILFQEWANRGIHLWQIADGYCTLVADTNEYIAYRSSGDGTSTLLDNAGAIIWCISPESRPLELDLRQENSKVTTSYKYLTR